MAGKREKKSKFRVGQVIAYDDRYVRIASIEQKLMDEDGDEFDTRLARKLTKAEQGVVATRRRNGGW